MSIIRPAMSSALEGLRLYSLQVDHAAESIARFGLTDDSPDAAPPANGLRSADPAAPADLVDASVTMLVAQRAFSAQLRVLETADEMAKESIDIGRHPSDRCARGPRSTLPRRPRRRRRSRRRDEAA